MSECYRLLLVPSFRPSVSVRLEASASAATAVTKAWVGDPFLGLGELSQDTRRQLAGEELDAFRALVKESRFWRLPSETDRAGLDGSDWVLEGRNARSHHVVVRWSPQRTGDDAAFRELCEFMLALEAGGSSDRPASNDGL